MIDGTIFGQPHVLNVGTFWNGMFSVALAIFAVIVGYMARFQGAAKWYAVFAKRHSPNPYPP